MSTSSSSSSSSSSSDSSKKNGKGKKKSKKEAKKAKKEAKKSKKLAKQIKKLEEEVERRKRQMNGEVQEKKKKKKKSSSSSSSSSKVRKAFKGLVGQDVHAAPKEELKEVPQAIPQGGEAPKRESKRSGSSEKESSSSESNPERHDGVICDHCAMSPIIGPRFKCSSCQDVSLCRICYKRRLEVHMPGHRFFAMKSMPEIVDKSKVSKVSKPQADGPAKAVLPIHVAPKVQPVNAPRVASIMAERWQNIGKSYSKTWQETQLEGATSLKVPALPVMSSGTTSAEVKEVNKVGKHLPRGDRCGLCLQQVMDSASGALCAHIKEDGSERGCGKGVCFPCMLRASSMMFGKVRITKEIWVTLSHKAWWMHERCMSEADKSDFKELIESFGLQGKLEEASAELPAGWSRKISNSTGKIFFVNAKLGKAQWEVPTAEQAEAEAAQARDDVAQKPADSADAGSKSQDSSSSEEEEEEELVEL